MGWGARRGREDLAVALVNVADVDLEADLEEDSVGDLVQDSVVVLPQIATPVPGPMNSQVQMLLRQE